MTDHVPRDQGGAQRRVDDLPSRVFILRVLKWAQPILLALIALATAVFGIAARKDRQEIRAEVAKQDATLDDIHLAVNSAKTRVDSMLDAERRYTAALEAQMRVKGMKPVFRKE